MKKAGAFSLLLCWKDKRLWNKSILKLKTCVVRIRKWQQCKQLWFWWLSSWGGQQWCWGSETSKGVKDFVPLTFLPPFISFYHFFVLFRFVVYWWTAVNDKRLRAIIWNGDQQSLWCVGMRLKAADLRACRVWRKSKRRRRKLVRTWGPLLFPAGTCWWAPADGHLLAFDYRSGSPVTQGITLILNDFSLSSANIPRQCRK